MKWPVNGPLFWGYIELFRGKKSLIQLIEEAGHFL